MKIDFSLLGRSSVTTLPIHLSRAMALAVLTKWKRTKKGRSTGADSLTYVRDVVRQIFLLVSLILSFHWTYGR